MENILTPSFFSNARMRYNVEYELRDKDGNIKPLFQENRLYTWLMKQNIVSPLAVNSPYFKYFSWILGKHSSKKNVSNLITDAGRAIISGLINGSGSPAAFTFIAVGTNTTAAAVGDTGLGTELATSGLSRAAGTVSRVTTTKTNDTAQVTITFSVTGTQAVTEAGLFNASSSVTILCHQVFSAINVVNTDSLQVTWKIQNT
ncbi:MAG TPA: hypothetical protein VFC63_19285 [Blastocatellia bacterium]|nr:hypothetical protein [Blastocatellia bacterium]